MRIRCDTAAAFEPLLLLALVAEKMFHRAEQVRTETSTLRVRRANASTREQARKKSLREFARGIFVAPLTPEKTEHGLVVRLATIHSAPRALRRFRRARAGRVSSAWSEGGRRSRRF